MMVKCIECGEWFDEKRVTCWQKVTGWEHKRFQGGTNHIAERVPLDEWRCDACMRLSLAGRLNQDTLL